MIKEEIRFDLKEVSYPYLNFSVVYQQLMGYIGFGIFR